MNVVETENESQEGTPIENVLEKQNIDEANEALQELNGIQPQPSLKQENYNHPNQSIETMNVIEEQDESMLDFWLQIILTGIVVTALVFIFFLPKVRTLLEPFIGVGYYSLGIRAATIGLLSTLPRLLII